MSDTHKRTPVLYYCCAESCPGYPYRASDMSHPHDTCGATPAAQAAKAKVRLQIAYDGLRDLAWRYDDWAQMYTDASTRAVPPMWERRPTTDDEYRAKARLCNRISEDVRALLYRIDGAPTGKSPGAPETDVLTPSNGVIPADQRTAGSVDSREPERGESSGS